ncbi:MAG: methyltransferase [Bacteroidota bacterium]
MRMRTILRPLAHRILPPITRWYLRKTRTSRYDGITCKVPPGVFHPGLYFSTRFMLKHMEKYSLEGKDLLEIGAGSGMISLWCAQKGASVTATDISETAVTTIRENAALNDLELKARHSDLFAGLAPHPYDFILINPPYYPGTPKSEAEHAWYCGPEFEYFQRLFDGLHAFRKPQSEVLMVLSEDCNIERIREIAARHAWKLEVIATQQRWGEWNFIYAMRYQKVG